MQSNQLRRCLKEPIPEHELAASLLSQAVDALLNGDMDVCARLLVLADIRKLREFAYEVAGPINYEIHRQRHLPKFDPVLVLGSRRMPSKSVEYQVYNRDNWLCRYCNVKVISKKSRDIFRRYFPREARKGRANEDNHFGLATLTASIDHVLPYKRGGTNDPGNLVTACGPCQFGRGYWLLEEVELEDPRLRPPIKCSWDGLMRVLNYVHAGHSG